MNFTKAPALALAALALWGARAWAQPARGPHSTVELVAEGLSIQPGKAFEAGLRFTMEPGWHIYWLNPGDSGTPPEAHWSLPQGYKAGAFEWPYPKRLEIPPLANYGYEKEIVFPVRIEAPADAAGRAALKAKVEWLICEKECLPARGETTLSLPVQSGEPRSDPRWAAAIHQAQKDVPGTFGDWDLTAKAAGRAIELSVEPRGRAQAPPADYYFFPKEGLLLNHPAPQPVARGRDGKVTLSLPLTEDVDQAPARLQGALVSSAGFDAAGRRALWVDVPIGSGSPLGWALLLAFIGGLLLNLMPCVFPVLAVKVLGFLEQSGKDPAALRRHVGAYVLGVLASFWALAGLLLALRAGGSRLGWGFQLQSPPFVALMACLFLAMGLNLLGVFEVGASLTRLGGRFSSAAGLGGSFGSGALAVLIATPCTAPFMGAALGAALALPPAAALAIFTALGAGMAAPYLALALRPAWLGRLPRSGAWLESFKQALAFPLLGTAVWLSWVYSLQTGVDAAARLWGAFLCLGFAAWAYGRWGQRLQPGAARSAARLAAGAALAAGLFVCLASSGAAPSPSAPAAQGGVAWEAWSPERLEALRREGRPVFVDFTAAWCVSCQVNERLVLNRSEVQDKFRELGVAALRADWTSRDPAITQALAAQGRSGVPMYLVYKGAAGASPSVLPTVLTPGLVLAELETRAKGS